MHPNLMSGQPQIISITPTFVPLYAPDLLFVVTFLTSVFSASKGMADFLMNGPCKLIPNTGLFGGMGRMGYILLFINISLTLFGKGMLIGYIFSEDRYYNYNMKDYKLIIFWTFLNVFPQLLLVSTNKPYTIIVLLLDTFFEFPS